MKTGESYTAARKNVLDKKTPVRKATDGRSARLSFDDGTLAVIWLVGNWEKSAVQIQHQKLGSKVDADARKAWWTERLVALAEVLG